MNSGGAVAAGGCVVSSDGIGEQMLPGYFVSIESQDENSVRLAKHLYLDACGHEKWQYAGHEKRIH
jgi:hypothetical protein